MVVFGAQYECLDSEGDVVAGYYQIIRAKSSHDNHNTSHTVVYEVEEKTLFDCFQSGKVYGLTYFLIVNNNRLDSNRYLSFSLLKHDPVYPDELGGNDKRYTSPEVGFGINFPNTKSLRLYNCKYHLLLLFYCQ